MKKTKRKFLIRIQSVSDIITNSSSEIYQIKSDITETMFREIWNSVLRDWGYSEEDIENDDTIYGIIRRKDNDYIILDYSIMCNLDFDALDKLRDIFGTENVKDITWEDW
jgi:hypothetical protein